MVLPNSHRVPRVPWYLGTGSRKSDPFRLRGDRPLWRTVPGASAMNRIGHFPTDPELRPTWPHDPEWSTLPGLTTIRFGLFPVRSPLLRKSLLFSLPRVTKMFQFTPFARSRLCIHLAVHGHDPMWVSPFRNPRIKACLAAPRGLSQPSTPFIAGRRLGIHRLPLVA